MVQIYNGRNVEITRVPPAQFEFSVGFGWAFRVSEPQTNNLLFRLIVKSFESVPSDENLTTVQSIGLNQIYSLIDDGYSQKEYCYSWEENSGLVTENCEDITPPQYRSPLI